MRRIALVVAALAAVVGLAVGILGVGPLATSAQEDERPIDTFLAKVAEKLGVSQEDLTTAIRDAQLEMIDEAVAEGRLSEEMADRLRERIEEGGILFPPPRPHPPRPGVCQRAADLVLKAAAEVLDMPLGELKHELKADRSLAQVAEAQGMPVDEFRGALLEQIRAQLDQMVERGRLTEEQAERIYQRMEENIDRIINAHLPPGRPCVPWPSEAPWLPEAPWFSQE